MTKKRGRKSIFDEAYYLKKVDEYLETCKDKVTTFHKTRGEKSDSYDRILKVNLPTFEGFAIFVNRPYTTIQSWQLMYPKFGEALNKILILQKQRLMHKGLSGEYNANMANFILSANHGMKQQSEVKVTHDILTDEQRERLNSFLK